MLPHVETLPNGLTLVLAENHASPVVALEVWVRVGSADELPRQAGLAHVHEHMLFKGTARRGVGQIAQQVEASGGEINARTSFDYTVYHLEMSSRFFESGADILADAVQNAAFDPDELGRELEVIQEEIKRTLDTPAHRASQLLFSTAYYEHPYGRPILGSAASVASFTRDDVLDFFHRWYVPSNMTFVAVGDFELAKAREIIANAFTGSSAPRPTHQRPAEPEPEGLRVCAEQAAVRESHLHMAFPIPAFGHEDVAALDVLSLLMGGGASSRLENRIRRERRLVNSIGTYAYTPVDPGLFTIAATFQDESAREVVVQTLREVLATANDNLSAAEIRRAKTLIATQTVYQQQTMRGLAQKYGFYQAVAQNLHAESDYLAAVDAVTADDLRRVSERYLRTERLALVLFSPQDAARPGPSAEELREWASEATRLAREPAPRSRTSQADRWGVHRHVLPDGTRVLVQRDTSVPLVSVWSALLGGLRFESAENNGISNLTAQMLTLGTPSRDAVAIAEQVEDLGAVLSGYSGHNTMGLSGTFLAKTIDAGAELFADCLLRSHFDDEEFDRERQMALEDLHAQADHLASTAFRQLSRTLYGAHPYALDALGSEASLVALDAGALRSFFAQRLGSPDRVIAFAGDIDPEQAIQIVERQLQLPSAASEPLRGAPPEQPATPQLVVQREDKMQAHLALGFLGTVFQDPMRYALDVIAALLSGQGGRLFLELRDKQSLAYSVAAMNRPDFERGSFSFYIAMSPEKLPAALRGIGAELARLREERVSTEELGRAQRYLIGAHDISLQRASTRASLLALHEIYGLGYDYHWGYDDRILGVDAEQILEAAQRILDPRKVIASAVLPPEIDVDLGLLGA